MLHAIWLLTDGVFVARVGVERTAPPGRSWKMLSSMASGCIVLLFELLQPTVLLFETALIQSDCMHLSGQRGLVFLQLLVLAKQIGHVMCQIVDSAFVLLFLSSFCQHSVV